MLLASCASGPPPQGPPSVNPSHAQQLIDAALPRGLGDRAGWSADIYGAFGALQIDPTLDNICAVTAIIAQESGFRVDPQIPDLPAIAWREIDRRAEHASIPPFLVHTALQLTSPTGRSYSDRIDHAKTEKDLSDIYEDFIGAVPMGRTLFADRNPIRTRGPMQVNIAFAEHFAGVRPYPYPVRSSIAEELFTRRGSVYFGTAHLLAYPAAYDSYLYRFADFNAGQYASRNAAFQLAVAKLSGISVTPDGALLPRDRDPKEPDRTELAVQAIAPRLNLSDGAVHEALEQGRSAAFEQSALYQRVFALADRTGARPLPRAVVPRIQLHGPKISRNLTTDWYAHRVEQRFRRCLGP